MSSNEEKLEEEKKEFDTYFTNDIDEYELKLYYINPDSKRRKEYVETFTNQIPHDDYITELYGHGHFWCMGMDARGKIKSKNIFISEMAVKRIRQKKIEEQRKLNPEVSLSDNNGYQNGNGNGNGFKEAIETIMPIFEMAYKRKESPLDSMSGGVDALQKMFISNMTMVNDQALNHTKKLVSEKMNDKGEDWKEEVVRMFTPAIENVMQKMFGGGNQVNGNQQPANPPPKKPQEPVDINPQYTQNVVNSLKEYVEDVLSSNDQRAEAIIEKIKQQSEYAVITSSPQQIDLFFETLSTTIGVPKAKLFMAKLGFEDEEDNKDDKNEAEFKDVTTDKAPVG